ncbi:MAG TPA: hypothetical protein VK052_04410 [Zeimonas sp.]|nr:hypothetical protein [Zeimonas sp.]
MPPPDEAAFRRRRDAAIGHVCPFERALLARCAACSLARSVLVAEREAIGCVSHAASERCGRYRDGLRTAARFALRADPSVPWPFSKEIRLQCGGLIGLRDALDEDDGASADGVAEPDPVADADALLRRALQCHGSLDALPFSRIMRAVIRHEPRRRAPR